MKSLKTVQTVSKILKIFVSIGTVCAYVGVGFCLVCGSLLIAVDRGIIGENIMGYFMSADFGYSIASAVQLFALTVIFLGWALALTATGRYLKHELADGTPFTYRGSQELMAVGVKIIVYPIAAIIAASIICAYGKVEMPYSHITETGLGVALIFLSFVFGYGAELEEKLKTK